jgi:hypothetical protein
MGTPSSTRFNAPTDGLMLSDSIKDIVAFETPAFFANCRWER